MKNEGWNVQITCPSDAVTSMNGVTVEAQQPLEFANRADVVVFGSGIYTRDIAKNLAILGRFDLNPAKQVICAQCSGTLLLATLGLLNGLPACTDLTTRPWVLDAGVEVLNQPFVARDNLATAGGCMSSQYLAAWIIARQAGRSAAESAIYYVAPVGEKEETVEHSMSIVMPFIEQREIA